MKVVHIIPDAYKEASGPTYSVTRLCESLLCERVEIQLALLGNQVPNDDRNYLKYFKPGYGPARLGRSPEMNRWLTKQVNLGVVDLIHNHSLWMMPNVYPGWATRGTKIPYVVSPHGTMSAWAMKSGSKLKKIFWPLIQKPSINHVAMFHATAVNEYEDIRRMGFMQPVAIIPNGIDVPLYRPKQEGPIRTLLFLGRLHPVKGIDSLLRSWARLQSEFTEWRLQISGPGDEDYVRSLKLLSSQLQLTRIHFSGPLYGADKFEAYRQADLYVLPSHSENFGMTIAEALACGTPCIVSKGAPWSCLRTRNAGWWHDISENALFDVLVDAMGKSQVDLEIMGENGRKWMLEDFAWPQIASSMHAAYDWLLKRGERPECVVLD
jgi:glycosyltransferase involved in cell wall biosynthesis